MPAFKLISPFEPIPPQQESVDFLWKGLERGERNQVLRGITGSGKTFMMAQIIARRQKPALIITHNKTLCAQLFTEFRDFFPDNAVEYFISYYDFYQPEAYVPGRDLYIEKTADINDEIDQYRHRATRALFEREDVVIIASVSCIYGLGSPELYQEKQIKLAVGQTIDRMDLIRQLIATHYQRNDIKFERGTFRVRGDTIDVLPASETIALRVELFGDEIENLMSFNPVTGEVFATLREVAIFPARHYLVPPNNIPEALKRIRAEMTDRVEEFKGMAKWVEAQRLESRTKYDLEMLKEVGYCQGIENYSRHLALRGEGDPPQTLLDYLPPDALIFLDESHATLPQLHGMYNGDRARKDNLVEYGYRLPSARDNRPLRYEEFSRFPQQRIHVSATPGSEEITLSGDRVVDQVIRPTGILDPEIEVVGRDRQIHHISEEIRRRVEAGERTLVLVLTKKMAEKLSAHFEENGFKTRYLHSEIDSMERIEIIRSLRLGEFDVLVGVNLLREGLDLPEVSLVAIFEADKQGFLRSHTTLLQISGRAARHINGKVIFYADEVSEAMHRTIEVTRERRQRQNSYNQAQGITPSTIQKRVFDSLKLTPAEEKAIKKQGEIRDEGELNLLVKELYEQMIAASKKFDFVTAARLRDSIKELKADFLDSVLAGRISKK